MAHNLHYNEHTGKYSFFSIQQKAWHNLGQVVDQYPTSAEAIQHAGLDFEVIKAPLFTQGGTMSIGDKGGNYSTKYRCIAQSFRHDANRHQRRFWSGG